MTLIVPFDGGELAQTALVRATQFNKVLDEEIVVVSVIPVNNNEYARQHDWIGSNETFDGQKIVTHLYDKVKKISPEAHFEHITVGRYAQAGTISVKLRNFAKQHEASIVFIGSENAGKIVQSVSSVGGGIAADRSYETMIIPHVQPTKIEEFERNIPTEEALEKAKQQ